MKRLTKPEVLDMLKREVEKKGADYVDPGANDFGCRYVNEDQKTPSCIVGHILINNKIVPPDFFFEHNLNETDVSDVSEHVPMTPAALEALVAAQSKQDRGATWGEALKAAKAGMV